MEHLGRDHSSSDEVMAVIKMCSVNKGHISLLTRHGTIQILAEVCGLYRWTLRSNYVKK